MSLLLNKEKINKLKERTKTENGKISETKENEIIEEKEQNVSKLTDIKVFNGLVEEEKDVFKNLNKKNNNKNTKNINDKESNLNNKSKKMIDLNYISFGDIDNLFINNLPQKKENEIEEKIKDNQKKINKEKNKNIINISENKEIQKNIVIDRLLNRADQSKNNKTFDLFKYDNEFNPNKKMNKKAIIEKKEKEIKNYFKISDIKKGEALLVTHDDIVFSFPACLLPRGAKLGETFSLEIKLFDKNYNNKEKEEIEQIQKKYINTENNNKEEEND